METARVWVFGNDVDTDQIIASQYIILPDIDEMKGHVFESLRPGLAEQIRPGDVLVAGKNFGAGSSREQAPACLKALGVKAVVANSFARIFFRNAINIGLPAIRCEGLAAALQDGDEVQLDLAGGEIIAAGQLFECTKLPGRMQAILNSGGLIAHLNSGEGQ